MVVVVVVAMVVVVVVVMVMVVVVVRGSGSCNGNLFSVKEKVGGWSWKSRRLVLEKQGVGWEKGGW